jgi:hypothetical protein
MLFLDQRLLEPAVALNDVHEVVHDTALAPHDQIEVAQSDVKVDHGDALAALRKSARDAGGRGGFPNAPFTRGHDDNFCQCEDLLWNVPSVWSCARVSATFQQPNDRD